MNSANKSFGFCLLLALMLAGAPVVAAEEPPPPTPLPLADGAEATSDASPADFVGEGPDSALSSASRNAEDVLRLLQSGNNGKPLTLAQLATINDAIKRLDYISQLETKINGSSGSSSVVSVAPVSRNNRPQPALAPSPGLPGGGMGSTSSLTVVRVMGGAGHYEALLSGGNTQTVVRVGDETDMGRVTSIDLRGVTIGGTQLPFAAPQLAGGASSRFR